MRITDNAVEHYDILTVGPFARLISPEGGSPGDVCTSAKQSIYVTDDVLVDLARRTVGIDHPEAARLPGRDTQISGPYAFIKLYGFLIHAVLLCVRFFPSIHSLDGHGHGNIEKERKVWLETAGRKVDDSHYLLFTESAAGPLISCGRIGVAVRYHDLTCSQSRTDQLLNVLGAVRREGQQLGHRGNRLCCFQESGSQAPAKRSSTRLARCDNVDTTPAQIGGKHPQLGGLAAAVDTLKSNEFSRQDGCSAGADVVLDTVEEAGCGGGGCGLRS